MKITQNLELLNLKNKEFNNIMKKLWTKIKLNINLKQVFKKVHLKLISIIYKNNKTNNKNNNKNNKYSRINNKFNKIKI